MPAKKRTRQQRNEDVVLLEFIAGALVLPANAKDADRVSLAARVGLSSQTAARVLGKTPAAAEKAMERARRK